MVVINIMDFTDMKLHLDVVMKTLDHKFLNETSPFDKVNPTAENIARKFETELKAEEKKAEEEKEAEENKKTEKDSFKSCSLYYLHYR